MMKASLFKPCPFCGSTDIDPKGWASKTEHGPQCQGCGATAETADKWNRRDLGQPSIVCEAGALLSVFGVSVWKLECREGYSLLRTERILTEAERQQLQQISGIGPLLFEPEEP